MCMAVEEGKIIIVIAGIMEEKKQVKKVTEQTENKAP